MIHKKSIWLCNPVHPFCLSWAPSTTSELGFSVHSWHLPSCSPRLFQDPFLPPPLIVDSPMESYIFHKDLYIFYIFRFWVFLFDSNFISYKNGERLVHLAYLLYFMIGLYFLTSASFDFICFIGASASSVFEHRDYIVCCCFFFMVGLNRLKHGNRLGYQMMPIPH